MRKRLAIVGHSEEGLALIPMLEANPDVEVCALVSDDSHAVAEGLQAVDPSLIGRFQHLVTRELRPVLCRPGLVALIDADAPHAYQELMSLAGERGVQVTTPILARLLYAFGPVDASRKPDLLHSLSEILESYNLTLDRRAILDRVLQIAVGATGAERGSLMLWDEKDGRLRVEVAIGIERELIPKIRLVPGEGIAGHAFATREAILVSGKADHARYRIARERDDLESSISAPLLYGERVLGVLNLSHTRRSDAFDDEDLDFVEQLARLDARVIARAEEYHRVLQESATLRSQAEVRKLLAATGPLGQRLTNVCRVLADELSGGLCQLHLRDPDLDVLVLQASSGVLDPLEFPGRVRRGEGLRGWVAARKRPFLLSQRFEGVRVCFAVLPLLADEEVLGVLSFEGAHEGRVPEFLREKLGAASDALAMELVPALRLARREREANKTAEITELAARMGNCTDSDSLCELITSAAAGILESEDAVLRLRDPVTNSLRIRSSYGVAAAEAGAPLYVLEEELANEASRSGQVLRIVDVSARPELSGFGACVDDALVQPLWHQGRAIGTLSVLGKATDEPVCGETYSVEDQRMLARLAGQAQGALAVVEERERSRSRQAFDDLTHLPNERNLAERLSEEVARAGAHDRALTLIRLRLSGLGELLAAHEQSQADRLVLAIVDELRGALREFDILARTGPDAFEILIPEPDADVSALVGPLARQVRRAISREADPSLTERLQLEFGYARFPEEGRTGKALRELAAATRISAG